MRQEASRRRRMSEKEIDTEYTSDPVCPWCGHKYADAWELNLNDGDDTVLECGECEKSFKATAYISVDYCTQKWSPLEQAKADLYEAKSYEKILRGHFWSYPELKGYDSAVVGHNHRTCQLEALVERLKEEEGRAKVFTDTDDTSEGLPWRARAMGVGEDGVAHVEWEKGVLTRVAREREHDE
jgi:ribosomal protein L37AE/L43A